MFTYKLLALGCVLMPILLFGGCCGKMFIDWKMYELPGKVLSSTAKPTRALGSPFDVAEALDAYVQPRFEILRDKNFGAFRIVYRKHAGIVQLKVDTPQEQEQIANVNAANRDYAICLIHCAPIPGHGSYRGTPELQLLYFNQKQVARDADFYSYADFDRVGEKNGFDTEAVCEKAIGVLPKLIAGKEHRAIGSNWDILMRPVLASKNECLSCHTNTKPGATLGVMLYAVRKTEHGSSAKIVSR